MMLIYIINVLLIFRNTTLYVFSILTLAIDNTTPIFVRETTQTNTYEKYLQNN